MKDQSISIKGDTRQVGGQDWMDHLAEAELAPLRPWKEPDYNAARYALVGLVLGGIAGCTSLILNVVGSLVWSSFGGEAQHPLRIIQVYLTFPLGEFALELNNGAVLALGCLLYLGTGMLFGAIFELVIAYFLPYAGVWARLVTCALLAALVWAVNFYGILIWLQPVLFGGNWIVELIPHWVALLTHVVFGLTIALLFPLGDPRARRPQQLRSESDGRVLRGK
jgi:hypothetical protein